VSSTALGLLGPNRLAASPAPLLDAAKASMGRLAVPVIVGAATVSILKTLNATALTFSRSLFAMGRAGAFPPVFAAIHPRFGTPYGALLFAYCAAMIGLFLPTNLTFLLLAVNIPTMLKYMSSSLSAVRIARDHPDIHARAAFRPSRRNIEWLGLAGFVVGGLILVAGLGADWRPYALIGGWGIAGAVYWLWAARSREHAVAQN